MNSGVLTKSVEITVCSPAALGEDVAEAAADDTPVELDDSVPDLEVAAAAASVSLEAGDADIEDEAEEVESTVNRTDGQRLIPQPGQSID